MSNAAFGVPFDTLMQTFMWSAVLMVVALLVDAIGRRKGEPDPPAQTEAHRQIETWLREVPTAEAGPRVKRI